MGLQLSRRVFLRGAAASGMAGAAGLLAPSCAAPAAGPEASAAARDNALAAASRGGSADNELYWSAVRRCFVLDPAITHLNTGTLGAMPAFVLQGVYDRMLMVARDPNSYHSPGTSLYEKLEGVRGKMAGFVNASADEIALTRNTTEGMNAVASGLALERGDEILTTDHEHVGGLCCWERKAAAEGVVVKKVVLPVPPQTEDEILARFDAAVTARTKMISISHVTCTTGLRLPVKRICRMAHDRGILVCVDGAQCLGWLDLDLHDLECDFYANSPHKWLLSPMGTGFLYVKQDLIDRLRPAIVSGGWDTQTTARKFENYGTRNLPEAIAVGDSVDFESTIGKQRIAERDAYLAERLARGLREIAGVRLLSPSHPALSSPLTTFSLSRSDGSPLSIDAVYKTFFERYAIRVRLVKEKDSGIEAIRLATHIYNSPECIDKLLAAVNDMARRGTEGA